MTRRLEPGEVAAALAALAPEVQAHPRGGALWVAPERLVEACRALRDGPGLAMDYLVAITAVDYVERFELVYHLASIAHNQSLVLKTEVFGRDGVGVPSVVQVWRGADLQEREVWDLMGVAFNGHPNMKRILTWEGFSGHPLRKDHLGG